MIYFNVRLILYVLNPTCFDPFQVYYKELHRKLSITILLCKFYFDEIDRFKNEGRVIMIPFIKCVLYFKRFALI